MIVGVAACAMLCSMNEAFGFYSESFERGTPTNHDLSVLGNRPVVNDLHVTDLRDRLEGNEPTICMDIFSEGENRNGLAVPSDRVNPVFAKNDEWLVLGETAGSQGNGNLSAPSWDVGSWIDFVLDAGLTNANMDFTWFPSSWVEDGTAGGANSDYLSNIASIPEPATYGLITIFGGSILLFRRRFTL